MSFDGLNDYVTINNTMFSFGDNSFSFMGKVNFNEVQLSNGYQMLFLLNQVDQIYQLD